MGKQRLFQDKCPQYRLTIFGSVRRAGLASLTLCDSINELLDKENDIPEIRRLQGDQPLRWLTLFALLVLATPAAARPWAAFYCGKLQIALIPSKYFDPKLESCSPCDGKTHFFDMKSDPDLKRPLSNRLFRTSDDGGLFYKGKVCTEFAPEEYEKLDRQ
jgi:hypothetical protein